MTGKGWLAAVGVVVLAGCARFQSRPLSPKEAVAAFDARSLVDGDLRNFLAMNHVVAPGQNEPWDLKQLTLAAFCYRPALAEARAQLLVAQAAKITAGQRPNPSVTVTPGYDTGIPDNPTPWIVPLSFDVPLETAGKRRKRVAQAQRLAEAAQWDLVGTVWRVRSQIQAALLSVYSTRETERLLSRQEAAQNNVLRLLEGQLAAGAISEFEITGARTALQSVQMAEQAAAGKSSQAMVELAHTLGVPLGAVTGVNFSFPPADRFPLELTRPEVRRDALLNRADVRGALADYSASQSALELEIANQYPDLHLGPGYTYNAGSAGDNQWSLGLTVTLPLFNHNEGPVAQAEAKRTQAAAHFLTVQANAITEIDGALAGYKAACEQAATAQSMLDISRRRLDSLRAQVNSGELAPQAAANAEVEFDTGAQNRLTALIAAQQARGALEDAMQSPLTLPQAALDSIVENHSK